MFNFKIQQYPIISMYLACQKYFNFKQGKHESVANYFKRFKTIIKLLEHYGSNVWGHPSLIIQEYKKNRQNDINKDNMRENLEAFQRYERIIKDRSIAFVFLKGAQKGRYGGLAYNLKSQFVREINQYPPNLNQALRPLTTHKKKSK